MSLAMPASRMRSRRAEPAVPLDRVALDRQIAALWVEHKGAGDAFRKAVVEEFRKALDDGRLIVKQHFVLFIFLP